MDIVSECAELQAVLIFNVDKPGSRTHSVLMMTTTYRVTMNGTVVASGLTAAQLMASDWTDEADAQIDEEITVRMTSSLAERMFRSAAPITARDLTEQHLDMLQCDAATNIELRYELGDASDAIRAGNRDAAVVQRVVAAYNARAGR